MTQDMLYHLSKPKDPSEAPWLENRPVEIDAIWLHVSSVGRYEVRSLLPDDPSIPEYARNVKNVTMQPAKWPFVAERQDEVSSRSLGDLLTHLRRQVDLLGAEFVTAGRNFTLKYGSKLKAWRVALEMEKEAAKESRREERREAKRAKKEEEERQARLEIEAEIAAMKEVEERENERKKKFAKK